MDHPDSLRALISVIVPCFNVEDYVEECIESIARQNSDAVEIIIIDDASTDKTGEVLEQFENRSNINFLRLEQNIGLGGVRNEGIRLARGEYLLFLDSDDWLVDEALPVLAEAVEGSRDDLIFFDFARVHKSLGATPSPCAEIYHSVPGSVTSHEDKIRLLDCPTMAWFKLYRREFIMDSGITFGNGHYEDVSWSYPLTVAATRIQVLPRVLYCYRQREGSILNRQDSRNLDLIEEYDKVFSHCERLGDAEYSRKMIEKAVGHYNFILFIRSDRLSWLDLKAFFISAHQQISNLDTDVVNSAIKRVPGNPLKRWVLLNGNLAAFRLVFLAVKVSRFIKAPIIYYRKRTSSRSLDDLN